MPGAPDRTAACALAVDESRGGVAFDVLVVPRASRRAVGPVLGDRLKVTITEPPVEGKANAAVVALLAQWLGVRRGQVEILAGHRGKRKRVRVAGVSRRVLLGLLEQG